MRAMKHRRPILFLFTLAFLSLGLESATSSLLFVRLVGMRVAIDDAGVEQFLRVIAEFARAEHGQMLQHDFRDSGGRIVTDIDVRFSEETFFSIIRFPDSNLYELTAYSHEKDDVWQPRWDRFISTLSSQFGQSRVTPEGATAFSGKIPNRKSQ